MIFYAVLLILEAMKMENSIIAPCDAHVQKINVRLNDRGEAGKALVIIEKKDESESNQQKI